MRRRWRRVGENERFRCFRSSARNLVVATSGLGDVHPADVALERKAVRVDAFNAFRVSAGRSVDSALDDGMQSSQRPLSCNDFDSVCPGSVVASRAGTRAPGAVRSGGRRRLRTTDRGDTTYSRRASRGRLGSCNSAHRRGELLACYRIHQRAYLTLWHPVLAQGDHRAHHGRVRRVPSVGSSSPARAMTRRGPWAVVVAARMGLRGAG
jgi:hypothetical protein